MMDAVAEAPAYMPVGFPVTAMTTGKVALDDVESEDATMPTDCTVPKTRVVESVGVIWACMPFLTEARSALPTLASTTQDVVEITTMSEVLSLLPEPLPEPEPSPEPFELPTVSPLLIPTEATVPVTVERNVAFARSFRAAVKLLFACASWAFADAICRDDELEFADVKDSSAAVRLALARVTADRSSLAPTVASACPLVTLSPTATGTDVTVPLTAKLRSAS